MDFLGKSPKRAKVESGGLKEPSDLPEREHSQSGKGKNWAEGFCLKKNHLPPKRESVFPLYLSPFQGENTIQNYIIAEKISPILSVTQKFAKRVTFPQKWHDFCLYRTPLFSCCKSPTLTETLHYFIFFPFRKIPL